MVGRLAGKTAIVTGSGQGIGEGIARVFAQEGANVVVATRSGGNGQAVVERILAAGGKAILVICDVRDDQAVTDLMTATVAAFGGLDIMVHNAAAFGEFKVADFNGAVFDDVINTNLRAAFTLSAAAIPLMKQRGQGRLLFTSSVTGPRVAMPGISAYAASKGGLNGFIRTAALELAPFKITANGVEPGYIMTQAMEQVSDAAGLARMAKYIPAGAFGTADDIGHAMLYLASDEAGYVTGQTIVVDGGSTLPESPFFMYTPTTELT
jgi:3-oxoacyl-[acyl-carrier protein] reductase